MLKILIITTAFVLVFITGYWMKHMGRPYNRIVFSFHKLLTLVVLVYLVLIFRSAHGSQPFDVQEWILAVSGFVAYIAATTTGGILNLPREMPSFVNVLHHLLAYATVITTLLLMFPRFMSI